jgi:hypothetical protein
MKAFVHKIVNGRPGLGSHGSVTSEYKTQANLIRFGVMPRLKFGESAQVELFYNWENRYGSPDKVFCIDWLGAFWAHSNQSKTA